jgi:hypothetical protein
MSEVYSNDFLKIMEDKSKSIFTIYFSFGNRILINSLIRTRIIQGATSTDDYKEIKFKAQSVKSLIQFKEEQNKLSSSMSLSINKVGDMVRSLTTQLEYLISVESCTLLGYNPENIIVINEKKFVFLGSEMVIKIKDEMSLISYPFSTNEFYVSPELLKIKELPSYVHYKMCYFSLGCLIMYALLSNDDFYIEYLKHQQIEKIIENLNSHPIKNTKLYWLLSRCLVEDTKKRSIILI